MPRKAGTGKKSGIKWEKVDLDTLSSELKASYERFVSAYDEKEKTQETFFAEASAEIESHKLGRPGKVPTFNYTGHVLMIGFVEPSKKKKKQADKGGFSLRPQ